MSSRSSLLRLSIFRHSLRTHLTSSSPSTSTSTTTHPSPISSASHTLTTHAANPSSRFIRRSTCCPPICTRSLNLNQAFDPTSCLSPWLPWPSASSRSYSSSRPDPTDRISTQSIIDQYRARRKADYKARNRSLLLYAISLGIMTLGLSYAAVPLYRVFCSVTGYNGTPQTSQDGTGRFGADRISGPVGQKSITVRFNADKSDTLDWKFWPCQKSVKVKPGETVLAFYKAKNLSDVDVLGVATYNVTPGQVAPYFAKVECFCFDEQRLLAGEEVDLPIFFFIDKEFVEDPLMKDIDDIVLSYTFFKARRNSFGHIEPDTSSEQNSTKTVVTPDGTSRSGS